MIDIFGYKCSHLKEQLQVGAAAIKRAREDGAVRNVERYAGAVTAALSMKLPLENSDGDGNVAILPNSFDVSASIRQTFADRNISNQISHCVLLTRYATN